METKECLVCKLKLSLSRFEITKGNTRNQCKSCRLKQTQASRQRRKDAIKTIPESKLCEHGEICALVGRLKIWKKATKSNPNLLLNMKRKRRNSLKSIHYQPSLVTELGARSNQPRYGKKVANFVRRCVQEWAIRNQACLKRHEGSTTSLRSLRPKGYGKKATNGFPWRNKPWMI